MLIDLASVSNLDETIGKNDFLKTLESNGYIIFDPTSSKFYIQYKAIKTRNSKMHKKSLKMTNQ